MIDDNYRSGLAFLACGARTPLGRPLSPKIIPSTLPMPKLPTEHHHPHTAPSPAPDPRHPALKTTAAHPSRTPPQSHPAKTTRSSHPQIHTDTPAETIAPPSPPAPPPETPSKSA